MPGSDILRSFAVFAAQDDVLMSIDKSSLDSLRINRTAETQRPRSRFTRRRLVFGFHRIFEVEDDEVRPSRASLGDRPRIRCRKEQDRPYGEQVRLLVAFRFRCSHDRRIMP